MGVAEAARPRPLIRLIGAPTVDLTFGDRYPYGVLLEQEGGVDNDTWPTPYEEATHYCRKHRVPEWVCMDSPIFAAWRGLKNV